MPEGPQVLTPEAIRASLRTTTIGRVLRVLGAVASTNALAMTAAQEGAPAGFCVVADRQTSGRGRRGRAWHSPPGFGLYTSILIRPRIAAGEVPLVTLAAGLAAAEAIHDATGAMPALKWPNDVLLSGRKVAGILTEMATIGNQVSHAVVGVGINVHQALGDFPGELHETATSLALATGKSVERSKLAAGLFNAFERWYAQLEAAGSGPLLEAGRRASATLGSVVEVHAEDAWRGVALDLDGDGALLVRDEAGRVRRVLAEDVSIRVPGVEPTHDQREKSSDSDL